MKTTTPFRSTVWLLFEKVVFLCVSLIVQLAIARYLQPELFGKLSYLLALVALVSPIMALGLNSIVSREVLLRPADTSQLVGSSMALRLLASVVVASITIVLAYKLLPQDDWALFSFLLISNIATSALVVDFWLQAHVANRYGVLLRLSVLAIFGVARLIAIDQNAELAVFVYLAGFELVFTGVLYLLAYHKLAGGLQFLQMSLSESRRLLSDSRWLLFSGIAAMIYIKVDQVMLGIMIGDRAVGIYVAAARISEVWYFMPIALVTSFFPQLMNKKVVDTTAYALDLQKLNDLLFALSVGVAIIVSLLSSWLLPFLFGDAYADSAAVLVVHVWVAVFVFMRSLLSKWLLTENLLRLSMLSQVLGAVANVALNYFLIPIYGPIGAAYATVISYAVAGYLVLFCHSSLWPMAIIVSRSFILPLRAIRHGNQLYNLS